MSDRRSPLDDDWQKLFDEAGLRAARAKVERERRRHRALRGRGRLTAALAVLIVVLGGAVAGALHSFTGDDGSRGAGHNPPRSARPIPPELQVAQSRVADPVDRTPPWGLRVYTGTKGKTCVLVGRVIGGRLGRLRNGRFAALDATAQGTCERVVDSHFLAVVRCDTVAVGGRSALYGVVDREVERLELAPASAGFRPLRPAPDGSFLVVRRGTFGFRGNRLRITKRGGRTTTLRLQPMRVC